MTKKTQQNFLITADEHYGHAGKDNKSGIILFCNRPFSSGEEMDRTLINNHNSLANEDTITIHAGDFTLRGEKFAKNIIRQLKGKHIFLKGSHDYWLGEKYYRMIWEGRIQQQYLVICHYAMLTWRKSHYNSWLCYGHSHGKLTTKGKTLDVGVDTNNFYPYTFDQIKEIMDSKPVNPNFIGK